MIFSVSRRVTVAATAAVILPLELLATACGGSDKPSAPSAGQVLQQAIDAFVAAPNHSPGIIVLTAAGDKTTVRTAGVADVETKVKPQDDQYMRLASVAKAFSGATAAAAVADKKLTLDDSIGTWLPTLPEPWHKVTLSQLLQHTSGIGDFSQVPAFGKAVVAALQKPESPLRLLSYAPAELLFAPGSKYAYSNSDNIAVALMVAAATHTTYEAALATYVTKPLGLTRTSLPSSSAIDAPTLRGYDVTDGEDVTTQIAAGWSWASGGVVGSPADSLTFIKAYASGSLTDRATHDAQFTFRPGNSEPTGPGTNSAGLGIFRYETSCGTFYGHTGNTAGYTQFIAASADGKKAVTVSINGQITPNTNAQYFPALRNIYELAVCAA